MKKNYIQRLTLKNLIIYIYIYIYFIFLTWNSDIIEIIENYRCYIYLKIRIKKELFSMDIYI